MTIYKRLGIRTVINGNATLTRLGGSIMPPEVVAAMADASKHFVDIIELQKRVGEEIAKLTHNEAAYVSCGAAAALTLSTAACITGLDAAKREKLPLSLPPGRCGFQPHTMKNEVIVHRHGRVGYDFAVRQVGVTFVEIGNENGTTPTELENAITEKTAAIFYFANPGREHLWVSYEEAIAIAKKHDVPLIVDAAAQLPPPENLWRFTQMGADLALFSGGKGLCGPQSSGLIVGKKSLIEAIAFNGPPHPFIGRGMKVGKEEMVGLLAAVEWYLNHDHAELQQSYEEQVTYYEEVFADTQGVTVHRSFPSEAGQPMPRTEIRFDEEHLGITRDEILHQLQTGEPSIDIAGAGANGVLINGQTLMPGEVEIIAQRLKEILGT
ncbi:aminotransferase class V-fold PLP-dependent enzyme [Candidatus Poribacteria bacterium]|nr:aminotransferase class V-fold PLP-dependent enzyme [Candidatus Poribacteria bacterium]MYH79939.1 aminotransferase class V-fold PLP-dependent enzyme [Candidatus Poribacteria bacterium]MYK93666.1 aminotransferase class V-fold PLP-dependent enzyme [Candidatus Poribacteria bacterium]